MGMVFWDYMDPLGNNNYLYYFGGGSFKKGSKKATIGAIVRIWYRGLDNYSGIVESHPNARFESEGRRF